jgi:ribonucrease Y
MNNAITVYSGYILTALLTLSLGFIAFLVYLLRDNKFKLEQEYQTKMDQIKTDLEIKNEKITLALEKKIQEKEEKFSNRLISLQENINSKEVVIVDQLTKLEQKQEKLNSIEQTLIERSKELDNQKNIFDEQKSKDELEWQHTLEKKSSMTIAQAKLELNKIVEQETSQDMLEWQKKYLTNIQDLAQQKASEIVSLAIQRCSSEVANEQTVTNIKLANDSDKGKIIGKNGRNLQWLEKTLGVEFIIDEANENLITISGFSSMRRHIAKRTVEKLLEDGRIHPASIEEMCEKSKAELAQEIAEAGEWACSELGIFDFSAKLIRLIGRLKFRTSYGQNMLKHAVEMAKLAKNLAVEMNSTFKHRTPIDIDICVKGALLHDIGKAIDEETMPKGNHIDLGEKICEMFALDWRIKKCVSSHHDESYYDPEKGFCIEAVLVDACDNISGGRPGARKDSVESYYQRMEALETIANNTEGVNNSWIMRGSRELWVFFDTTTITPAQMRKTVKNIADNVQANVNYPGEIKVIGMWEDKIVEYAH